MLTTVLAHVNLAMLAGIILTPFAVAAGFLTDRSPPIEVAQAPGPPTLLRGTLDPEPASVSGGRSRR